ncbi:HAMP domain-containing histidine kinase [Propioniciclava sinopodophylli]|uniref:histidine kinase n=1 Tax=Propioniciclava sinopodophylli TaxID=1837344 RepID=A0A4Q9KCE8_9ACTN|nr:HAMP domain-containing histidine kinase [Propioniciclava sinopodophylli]
MTVEQALVQLRSTRAGERLKGVRLLAEVGDATLLPEIRALARNESDSWVLRALEDMSRRWRDETGSLERGETWISIAENEDLEDARAEAISVVTRVLVHESRGLLMRIDDSAREELADHFESSETARAIDRMRAFLRVVHQLHDAAASPRNREFDLGDFLASGARDAGYGENEVLTARNEPVIVFGDPDLLELAYVNVIRNAVEASEGSGRKVVCTCGHTDSDVWITVLDEGIGLPTGFSGAAEPGQTTKSKTNHFGWGLTIAQRAIHSLGGSLTLRPRDGGGTACEIRWTMTSDPTSGESY